MFEDKNKANYINVARTVKCFEIGLSFITFFILRILKGQLVVPYVLNLQFFYKLYYKNIFNFYIFFNVVCHNCIY